jgi:hypothetical protein
MKKTILALSMLSLVFVSCKKDDKDPDPITPTKENLTASYKMTGMTWAGVNVFNNADENANFVEACERDDVYTLKADLTAERTDAGTQCSPASTATGSWEFTSSNNTILISDLSTTMDIEGTVKSWNGKTLVVEDNSAGFVISVTLQKQ